MAILHSSDYWIIIHNSRDGSGDNEAEHTNSAIGDRIVDGATIQWETFKKIDGLTDDEIEKLSVSEYDKHEFERMEKNAWIVANEVRNRIDGALVFSEFINAFLSGKEEDSFLLTKAA